MICPHRAPQCNTEKTRDSCERAGALSLHEPGEAARFRSPRDRTEVALLDAKSCAEGDRRGDGDGRFFGAGGVGRPVSRKIQRGYLRIWREPGRTFADEARGRGFDHARARVCGSRGGCAGLHRLAHRAIPHVRHLWSGLGWCGLGWCGVGWSGVGRPSAAGADGADAGGRAAAGYPTRCLRAGGAQHEDGKDRRQYRTGPHSWSLSHGGSTRREAPGHSRMECR